MKPTPPKVVTHLNQIHSQPPVIQPAVPEPPAQEPQVQAEAEQPQPQQAVATQSAIPSTHEEIMSAAGIANSEFAAVDYIVSHESSWNIYATEPTTGAYGLCQALPAVKMASAGSDWQTNPVTQLRWCSSYATDRYGGWWGAYNAWVAQRWW